MLVVLVVPFDEMSDENAIRHLETRHGAALAGLKLLVEPGRDERRFRGGRTPWNTYHDRLHGKEVEHEHDND